MSLPLMGQLFLSFRVCLKNKMKLVATALCFFSGWVVGLTAETSTQGVMQGFEQEIQGIFDRTKDSVVKIKTIVPVTDTRKGNLIAEGLSIGTGFFVDHRGYIFTASSVLRGSTSAIVYWRGKTYEAQSVGQDPRTNLALLKINAQTPSLPFGDPDALRVGSLTLAVGYPMDAPISAEYGFVSNLDAVQMAHLLPIAPIRCSIRAQPGQSGSPILNSKGEVVGMLVYTMMDGSSSFALPITAAQKIQHDLLKYHQSRPGWMGLTIEVTNNLPSSDAQIYIRDVYQGCPGHVAGISSGDVLLKIGDKSIRTAADVMKATFYLSVGETVNFTIEREGEMKVVPVKVVPRPTDQELLALKPISLPLTPAR